ncbi:MAG: hypothetical protein ACIAXF_08505 [Phycisphaerales bacterium JB063]
MKRLLLPIMLLAIFALPAPAQSPAELAPADTQVYLHIDGFNDWLGVVTQGPRGAEMLEALEDSPRWQGLLALLEMDSPTFFATYFGGDVVLFAPQAQPDGHGVMFTQVALLDAQHAVDRLFLEAIDTIGDTTLYRTADGNGCIAVTDGWVGLCDLQALDYMRSVVAGLEDADSLADTAGYAHWTGLLPVERTITAYVAAGANESHALGVTRVGNGMDVAYFGKSAGFEQVLEMLGETEVADFGPLPAATLAAATFNLVAPDNVELPELMMGLNILAAPASFTDDILPKLGTPTVLFMGSVSGDAVEPAVGLDVPVLGMAVKMDDVLVANDLTGMMDKTMLLANLATAQWGVDPIQFERNTYLDSTYRVAHVGVPLAQQSGWPELEAVQVVYGQVGEYYVVCTQEHFFQQCIDAERAGVPFQMQLEGPVHERAKTPILAVTVRPDGIADLLRTWRSFVEDEGPELGIDVPVVGGELGEMIQILDQYSLMKMQLWRGEDDLVVGRIQITAPF